jgi:hypothetical protein
MAIDKAKTVAGYLRELEPERRAVLAKVRKVVNENLPKGYTEGVGFGMITWLIPLSKYPDTYNGQPLCYVGLAAQKNYNALYLMGAYADPKQDARLRQEFRKRGLKLDMGKSCLRFRTLDDLPLDVIGDMVRSTPPDAFIARYEAARTKKRRTRTPPVATTTQPGR